MERPLRNELARRIVALARTFGYLALAGQNSDDRVPDLIWCCSARWPCRGRCCSPCP
ncbi:hypothetical protein [Lentzea sp. NEAU-D7]|uniref:hypothetical protein n=1 Tax=Lentzea sp. NEAU-D7 TaxID=2994667 RepID=UPI00224B544D|nr:hypothetical protein [Lentzea sp. NEAU-D7]MCX2951449.1 hypothetical protein [Lentzea sp. NEAU-D7]